MVTMQCLTIKQPTQVDLRVEVSHPLLSVDELCTQYGACIFRTVYEVADVHVRSHTFCNYY